MDALRLSALLAYTFGALAYGGVLVMWVRELGRLGWGARPNRQVDVLNGALTVVSFLWFCGLIAQLLVALAGQRPYWLLEAGLMLLAYAFPPLIMHMTWVEVRARRRSPGPWRAILAAGYVAAAVLPLYGLSTFFSTAADGAQIRTAWRVVGAGLPVLFIITAIFCMAIVRGVPSPAPARERGQGLAMGMLFGLMLVLFVLILTIGEFLGGTNTAGYAYVGSVVEILAKSLPLIFLFVSAYFESRFYFFDLFVKRGFSLVLAVGVLAVWFMAVLPLLAPYAAHPIGSWLFALAVLPILALAPWVYSRVGRLLDRRVLGRPYSMADAVTRFLSALRSSTTEADAITRAEGGLSDIFRAPVVVRPDGEPAGDFPTAHEAPVACTEGARMRILLGPRAGDTPYFSQDAALVRSLADVFASVLDNLRLQARRHAEAQRAQELSLIASQSELKALRAQINPHFLFNALNAIAGLLHRDPATADRTIEKLADVFRYTLRGSETEWARLDDELEFVRAYLDVEEARFGERLRATIAASPEARSARIPAMIVHTLVENAVKHGAAAVRGHAHIDVAATVEEGQLRVSVCDNGPGLRGEAGPRKGGGYGLVNVRERLAGHFGDAARLDLTRDEARAQTVATILLPHVTADDRRPVEVTR